MNDIGHIICIYDKKNLFQLEYVSTITVRLRTLSTLEWELKSCDEMRS